MSLVGQTVWVVGGVGVVGRGIARGLLKAGATVIVSSRSEARLERITSDLDHPERLVPILGSLLPGQAAKTVSETLKDGDALHHVVAHGAVRYWTTKFAGCDETYSLTASPNSVLEMTPEEFAIQSSQLASYHFAAAQELIPRLARSGSGSSYTFVTGDGGGHPSTKRSAIGDINSHHVWGLSAALRDEFSTNESLLCREVRVGLPVNRPAEEREADPRERPLSEDIGDLCAGLVSSPRPDDNGKLMTVESTEELHDLLIEYHAADDKNIKPLPSIGEFMGSL